MLKSIENGPLKPVTMSANGPVDVPPESLSEVYGFLSMCLSTEITQTLRECTTSKALWDALVEKFEGNLDMMESQWEMLNEEFNINHIQGERIHHSLTYLKH